VYGVHLFPFLIGTVRTLAKSVDGWDEKRFPFLIGTVRTLERPPLCIGDDTFPFLIGTVRTVNSLMAQFFQSIVSIPHRYGKNTMCTEYFRKDISIVSIPHRYGKNYEIRCKAFGFFISFHSS